MIDDSAFQADDAGSIPAARFRFTTRVFCSGLLLQLAFWLPVAEQWRGCLRRDPSSRVKQLLKSQSKTIAATSTETPLWSGLPMERRVLAEIAVSISEARKNPMAAPRPL